jgi:hypothetical protein
MLSLSKLLSIVCLVRAVAGASPSCLLSMLTIALSGGPSSKRQDDPALSPATPDGYELVFGPIDAANSADGVCYAGCDYTRIHTNCSQFMGFINFDTYDVQGCAEACNGRAADAQGGPCEYINIWRAVIDDKVGPTTCSFVRTSIQFRDVPATDNSAGSISLLPMRQRR